MGILKKKAVLEGIIINYFGYLSREGQSRLLNDLKRTSSQYLCCKEINGKIDKSVKNIGVPTVNMLKNEIKNFSNKIDSNINWKKTNGKNRDYSETTLAYKAILELCNIIYGETHNIVNIEILLDQLTGNKSSILRGLAEIKFQSKTPGNRLVGKQTDKTANTNIGYVEEHVFPVKCFVNYFIGQIKNKSLVEDETNKVLEKYFIVNLNTDDDILLAKSGYKNAMTINWNPLTDDPFIRYMEAGIDINTIIPISIKSDSNGVKKQFPNHNPKKAAKPLMKTSLEQNICEIILGITYLENDFFNISVNDDHLLGDSNSDIKIAFNGIEVNGLIDRKNNNYKFPRIRNIGNEYKAWIKNNFKLSDTLYVEIVSPNFIRLHKEYYQ